jgi:hypothetical protein
MGESGSNHKTVIFIGLMLGMLVAAVSQTIVSPAMPVIVTELGGIEHYSWIATSALLASAVIVPIVGKLSDIYGRRGFYIAGLLIFMLGSILAGVAQGFWWLVAARAVQGLGMGTIMPLAQAIIGDIISPRERQVHGLSRWGLRNSFDRRTAAGWLDHGQFLLALALLCQPAHRRCGACVYHCLSAPAAHPQKAYPRLRGFCNLGAWSLFGAACDLLGRHTVPLGLMADHLLVRSWRA